MKLRQSGNSLILVEHDPEFIEWGEYIVDMGPGSGSRGGNVVYSGSKERFFLTEGQTARAIKKWREECRHSLLQTPRPPQGDFLEIAGASGNNLKNIQVIS